MDLLNAYVDRIKLVTRDSVLKYNDKSVNKDAFDRFLPLIILVIRDHYPYHPCS